MTKREPTIIRLPPAAAIRARYAERLKDPRNLLRLLRARSTLANYFAGLRRCKASATPARSPRFAARMR